MSNASLRPGGRRQIASAPVSCSVLTTFTPKKDIPQLNGKFILVTGANAGLGKAAVAEFCRHQPSQVWLAARSPDKARAAADEIERLIPDALIKLLNLDLSSFDSFNEAAKLVLQESSRLDILMLNTGIMATAPGLTRDCYKVQFSTNHLGHALLTKLLISLLEKIARDRAAVCVVRVSSHGHHYAPTGGFLFDTLKTQAARLTAFERCGQSKLANILWERQLVKLYPQFTVAAVHPGVVKTNLLSGATDAPLLFRAVFGAAHVLGLKSSVETGVKNQLWASVSKDVVSGNYYEPVGAGRRESAYGQDDKLAEEIWRWTENELREHAA
ncbi:NAD(P)-binding protein [Aspergillus recurvatus]